MLYHLLSQLTRCCGSFSLAQTECFFLTACACRIGLVRSFAEVVAIAEERGQYLAEAAALEASGAAGAAEAAAERRQDAAAMALEARLLVAALTEPRLVADSIGFFRLVARWLSFCAKFECPPPAPPSFATLPEWLIDDAADALLQLSRHAGDAVARERLDELLVFCVRALGAPAHIRSPYLRAKFVEVLVSWMPRPASELVGNDPERSREYSLHAATRPLFEHHPVATSLMVPHLLALYVDIEAGTAHGAFFLKFAIRDRIGALLEYLWTVPAHAAAWRMLAATPFYLRFVNSAWGCTASTCSAVPLECSVSCFSPPHIAVLINDTTFTLDEAVRILPGVRETEEMKADGRWNSLSRSEQQARSTDSKNLQPFLRLAMLHIRIMRFTSADGACAKPMLSPEMVVRVAETLNYFLAFLAGEKRATLRLPHALATHYGWDPKALLAQLCGIYVNLQSVAASCAAPFAASVAGDARSYRDDTFAEAAKVLRDFDLLPERTVRDFEDVGAAALASVGDAAAMDLETSDAPPEFVDPLLNTLMSDPVMLPCGQVCDRAVIARQLLDKAVCPFTRQPLDASQLVPQPLLKQRIDAWKAARRAAAAGDAMVQ